MDYYAGLTAHALARMLLAGPDLPVVSIPAHDGDDEYVDAPQMIRACEVYVLPLDAEDLSPMDRIQQDVIAR